MMLIVGLGCLVMGVIAGVLVMALRSASHECPYCSAHRWGDE